MRRIYCSELSLPFFCFELINSRKAYLNVIPKIILYVVNYFSRWRMTIVCLEKLKHLTIETCVVSVLAALCHTCCIQTKCICRHWRTKRTDKKFKKNVKKVQRERETRINVPSFKMQILLQQREQQQVYTPISQNEDTAHKNSHDWCASSPLLKRPAAVRSGIVVKPL